MTAVDLDRLEQLARAATPGKWHVGPYYTTEHTHGRGEMCEDVIAPITDGAACYDVAREIRSRADAAFIAALSPDVVIELVQRVRKAEADLAKRPVIRVRECRNCGSPNHDECTRKLY